jgi:tRNA modification GTPase
MNLLLKRDRVIVSPVPGTTRDAIEEMISLRGLPIRLVDTAGISKTKDSVEAEGVERAARYLRLADIVLLVVDASSGITKKDTEVARMTSGKSRIVIVNKIDLAASGARASIRRFFKRDRLVEISVTEKTNIASLEKTIIRSVWRGGYDQGESAIVTNARHKELLDKALDGMLSVDRALGSDAFAETIAVDLKEASCALGCITGRSVSDDILDRIFERFCIGK